MLLFVKQQRRLLDAAADAIASELAQNAEVSKRVETGDSFTGAASGELQVDAWSQHRATAHVLSNMDPQLWVDLTNTYAAIFQTKARGAYPPSSAHLLNMQDRLRTAASDFNSRKRSAPKVV